MDFACWWSFSGGGSAINGATSSICLEVEVFFIDSQQFDKTGVNPEFAPFDSKNVCTGTYNVFPPYLKLAIALVMLDNNKYAS